MAHEERISGRRFSPGNTSAVRRLGNGASKISLDGTNFF